MIKKRVALVFVTACFAQINAMEIEQKEKKEELFKRVDKFGYLSRNAEVTIKHEAKKPKKTQLCNRGRELLSLDSIDYISFSSDDKYFLLLNKTSDGKNQFVVFDLENDKEVFNADQKEIGTYVRFFNKPDSFFSFSDNSDSIFEYRICQGDVKKEKEIVVSRPWKSLLGMYLKKELLLLKDNDDKLFLADYSG